MNKVIQGIIPNEIINNLNITNLKRLVELLKTLRPEQFDMNSYRPNGEVTRHCGTIACIMGYAPLLLTTSKFNSTFIGQSEVSLTTYIEYNLLCKYLFGIDPGLPIWSFIFSANWVHYDNTISGAIARIQFVIDNSYHEFGEYDIEKWFELYNPKINVS